MGGNKASNMERSATGDSNRLSILLLIARYFLFFLCARTGGWNLLALKNAHKKMTRPINILFFIPLGRVTFLWAVLIARQKKETDMLTQERNGGWFVLLLFLLFSRLFPSLSAYVCHFFSRSLEDILPVVIGSAQRCSFFPFFPFARFH